MNAPQKAILLTCSLVVLGGIGYSLSHQTKATFPQNQAAPAMKSPQALKTTTSATIQHTPIAPTPLPGIPVMKQEPEIIKFYNSYEELADISDSAIEGTVLDATPCVYQPPADPPRAYATTQVRVQVQKSFTNLLHKGDVITIMENGGVIARKSLGTDPNYILTPNDLQDKVQVLIDGVPVMAPGEDVLLFISPSQIVHGPNNETYYSIRGMYQGKFLIQQDTVFRVVPEGYVSDFKSLQSKLSDAEAIIQARMQAKSK